MAPITTLTARDIMTKEPTCASPGMSLHEFQQLRNELEVTGAPVINAGGKLVGVASTTDMIRRMGEGTLDVPPAFMFDLISDQGGVASDFEHEVNIFVEDIMTSEPVSVSPDEQVSAIAQQMAQGSIHRVIVVDKENYPIGIITSLDVLKVFPQ